MARKTYYRFSESGEVYALTYAPSAPGWEQLSTRAGKEARRARRLALAIWLGYGACLAVVTYYAFTWS